jgi:hypothetical protein
VDVDMHSALLIVDALDQQPQVLAMQRGAVVFGAPVEPGQRLPVTAPQKASSQSWLAAGTSITILDSLL